MCASSKEHRNITFELPRTSKGNGSFPWIKSEKYYDV